MGMKGLISCVALLLLWGHCSAGPAGREFVTVFMQNYLWEYGDARYLLEVSAPVTLKGPTEVQVTVPQLKYVQKRTIGPGEGVTFQLPADVEMVGGGKSGKTVRIEATQEVTVMSLNYKPFTSETSVVYPVTEWGTEYYVYTPTGTPLGTYKEFSITNHKARNLVEVYVKDHTKFQGQVYRAGSKLSFELEPFESVQIQSDIDLTASRVVSKLPVAVITGHTCTWKFTRCNHVYEQLLPVSSWGRSFVVAPLDFKDPDGRYDSVVIQASQTTRVTVQEGDNSKTVTMNRGDTVQYQSRWPVPIHITADKGIQVFFEFNGAVVDQGFLSWFGESYDPFLMTILPVERFCTSYTLEGQLGFNNMAVVVARTKDLEGLTFDKTPFPKSLQWRPVTGSEYSWAQMSYPKDAGLHRAAHRSSSFGLYSLGFAHMNGYGSPAICNPVDCSMVNCAPNEDCQMKGDAPSCVKKPPAPKMGSCLAMGDPHYRTFDGRYFNFMGNCTYTMAKSCHTDKDQPTFEVEAQNTRRGKSPVTSVSKVIVKVYGYVISVLRGNVGLVRVNYEGWGLPISLDKGKVVISQSGMSMLLETDFGLTVQYDWDQYMLVTVPGSYAGKVCGLCGNFNGKQDDDLATPTGSQANDVVALGKSWRVHGVAGDDGKSCQDECTGKCANCKGSFFENMEAKLFCSIISTLMDGPFRSCHTILDPKMFHDMCMYDFCMGEGAKEYLCDSLQVYTDACQRAGIKVYDWRNLAGCPKPKCPENSHYENCGNACPASCENPKAPSKCKLSCVETCVCNTGYLLSGNQCVLPNQCGCMYEGRYAQPGKPFWGDDSCTKSCQCNPTSGKAECHPTRCPFGKQCTVVDGIRGCHPTPYAICRAASDSHFLTFDGQQYNFTGTCVYQLAGICSKKAGLEPFNVLVQSDVRDNKAGSVPKLVEVNVYGYSIVISKRYNKNTVKINKEIVTLPVNLPDKKVLVYKSGLYAVIETNFGLRVSFDWAGVVIVNVSIAYEGAVCGLCGNYNHEAQDDLKMKDGKEAASTKALGQSWRVAEIPGCVDGCRGTCPDCDFTQLKQYESLCHPLLDPKGPFHNCHPLVDPKNFYQDCLYDLCLENSKGRLCHILTIYNDRCQDKGAKIEAWRNSSFCKDCSMVKCAQNEDCQMKGDAPSCVKKPPALKMGSCLAMGDPHYRTFDGRYFNFMGNCTYTMAKSCHTDKDQPTFEVEAQNTRHGKSPVTSISKVIVKVYGYVISVLRGNVGLVRVNYEGWGLPIDLDKGKVVISQSGMSMLLETDFGLTVQYDWDQYMLVTVPGSYAGKVCGLCGNFNGKQDDDLATPTGSQANDVVALGKSWRVHGVAGDDGNSCQDECTGKCANCKGSFFENMEAKLFCSIISTLMDGPFRSCHTIVDPKMFHDMCMYDFCMGEGAKEYLCDSLQVYTDACQRAGIKVYDWRNLAGCPKPKCPENSHYENCGNACPASCENPKAPSKCKLSCVETCVCNPGYLLSGNQCVLPDQCGCMYEGRYAQPGKPFWGDDSCTKSCQCNPTGGKAECHPTRCPTGTQCTVVDGIRDCHPIPYATCLATSDSHFLTFDGQRYNFTGTCVYQLAGVCSKKAGLEPFDVLVQNNVRDSRAGAIPKLVEVNVYGYSIVISKRYNKNTVMINEEIVNLPVSLSDNKVLVYKSGRYAVIETSFGLRVSFDWLGVVIVSVPSAYEGAMCGLCGNYNHEAQDDMKMKDGKEAASTKALGQSWRVAEIPGCVDGCNGTCPSCDFTQLKQYESLCYPLLDPKGPFKNCHPLLDPKGFYQDCLYDLCLDSSNGSQCPILASYTALCQDKGAKIEVWRTPSFCSYACVTHSRYEVCTSSCQVNCATMDPPTVCKSQCREGCLCDEGYVLSGEDCVPLRECGCKHEGRYYKLNEAFYTPQCEQECTCTKDGKMDCKKNTCGAHKQCQKKNGAWGCQPVGYCSIYGDPHYQTFDNISYTFQGTCTYTVAQFRHPDKTGLPPFSVVVENERWYGMADSGTVGESTKVSVAKLVAVEVYGFTIILRRNQVGMIMVNGIMYNLPLSLDDGAVVAFQNGMHDVIKTNFGLEVTYDLVYKVSVTVPDDYRGKTSGLCGNFNGKKDDEFLLPNGTLAKSLQVFGAAWKVAVPGVICDDGCNGDFCPKCDEKKKATFERDCAVIKKDSGPFSACFGVLDPSSYFRDCVYDVCMSGGDRHALCGSIEAYVSDCQNMGVSVQNWRSPNFCPLACPANSHYKICAETCATPCPGLPKISSCHSTCAEGCACDDGYSFNGTSCVEKDRCGCFSEGRTYKRGESVISKDCREKCTCAADGQVQCRAMSCASGERCLAKDGVLGCYPTQCMLQAGGVFTEFSGTGGVLTSVGVYELVSVCPRGTEAEWFRVVVDVRTCEESSLPAVVAVYVFFEDLFVLVNKNHETWVNGKKVTLPKMLQNEISVKVSDKVVVIERRSGLHLTYNVKQEVSVSVGAHLTDKLCGACGEFTGDTNLFSIFGKPSIQSYMDKWRALDFPSCGLSTASTNIL